MVARGRRRSVADLVSATRVSVVVLLVLGYPATGSALDLLPTGFQMSHMLEQDKESSWEQMPFPGDDTIWLDDWWETALAAGGGRVLLYSFRRVPGATDEWDREDAVALWDGLRWTQLAPPLPGSEPGGGFGWARLEPDGTPGLFHSPQPGYWYYELGSPQTIGAQYNVTRYFRWVDGQWSAENLADARCQKYETAAHMDFAEGFDAVFGAVCADSSYPPDNVDDLRVPRVFARRPDGTWLDVELPDYWDLEPQRSVFDGVSVAGVGGDLVAAYATVEGPYWDTLTRVIRCDIDGDTGVYDCAELLSQSDVLEVFPSLAGSFPDGHSQWPSRPDVVAVGGDVWTIVRLGYSAIGVFPPPSSACPPLALSEDDIAADGSDDFSDFYVFFYVHAVSAGPELIHVEIGHGWDGGMGFSRPGSGLWNGSAVIDTSSCQIEFEMLSRAADRGPQFGVDSYTFWPFVSDGAGRLYTVEGDPNLQVTDVPGADRFILRKVHPGLN